MTPSRIQSLIALTLGAVLIILGIMQRNKRRKILAQGIEVEGEVFNVIGDSTKSSAGRPVIQFTTKDQVLVTEQYKITVPFSKKGRKVILRYNAANPKQFIVKEIL